MFDYHVIFTIPRKTGRLTFIFTFSISMILAESNNPCVQINEIVTTGKLSKLERFENDEKVMDKVVHDCQYIYFLKEQERARPLLVMHKKIKKYAERKRQKHNYNKESSESLVSGNFFFFALRITIVKSNKCCIASVKTCSTLLQVSTLCQYQHNLA